MAKTKFGDSDNKINDELDIPDFDFDFGEPKDDRKPVEQILSGVKAGVTSTFRDTGFLRRMMRESLPPVYGQTEDIISNSYGHASEILKNATKEIKPAVAQLVKSSENLIPEKFKRSRKAIDYVKNWAEGYKVKAFSQEDRQLSRDRNIDLQLTEVFSSMAKANEETIKEDKARETIKETLEVIRHKDSQSVLGDIRHHASRLTQYNEKVNQAYQKKSLELQYRSYFAQLDMVEHGQKLFQLSKTSYESIIKNTALPEFVKLKNSERFKEFARNKLIESLFGTTHSFINKTFKNIGVKVRDYTEIFKDTLSAAAMGADTAGTGKEAMEMSGTSLKEELAKDGTSAAIQYMALRSGSKIREKLLKHKGIKKFFDEAQYKVNNLPELLTEYANTSNFEDSDLKAGFKNVLKDLIGNQLPDSSLKNDALNSATELTYFSRQTNKSIIEIIPGYLARILREVQVLRTGDTSIDLTVYDPLKNKFLDRSLVKKSIFDKLFPESSIKSHEESRKDIFELIDPENKLSDDRRTEILKSLTKDKFNRVNLSPENLTQPKFFKRHSNLTNDADQIANIFKSYFTANGQHTFDSDEYRVRRNKLSSATGKLGRYFNNPSADIQELINAGYYDELRELGLINETGSNVNLEEVIRQHDIQASKNISNNSNVRENIKAGIKPINIVQADSKSDEQIETIKSNLTDNSTILREFLNTNKEFKLRFDSFVEDNSKLLSGLESNLSGISAKDEVIRTNEILIRIEQFLINELPKMSFASSNTGVINDPENAGYIKDNLWNNIRGLSQKTVGKAWKNIFKPLSTNIVKGTFKSLNLAKNSLAFGLKTTAKLSNALTNILVKTKDIFVEGEIQSRLSSVGLKAGIYRDNVTGKIIRTIGDLRKLKGDVEDDEGNVVLSKNEVGKTFVKRIEGTGVIYLGKYLGTKAIDLGKFTTNQIFKGMGMIGTVAKLAKKAASFILDHPVDIFLTGSQTPILYANIMRSGGYISFKTKKPISKPSEIDGPILDTEGNYVLTAEQLKQGLVDKFGKPITTPFLKLLGMGFGLVKTGVKAALAIGKFGTNLIKNGLGKTGDFLQGVLDVFNTGIGGKKSQEVLIQIRDILDNRLPKDKSLFGDSDKDGDRDNGWRDIFSRNKEKEAKDKELKDSTVKTGRQNTFDRIADAASSVKDSILSALGLGDDEDDDIDIDIDSDSDRRRKRRGRGRRSKIPKKTGMFRKAGRLLGGLGKGALSATGWLGRGLLTAGAATLGGGAAAAGTGAIGAGAAGAATAGAGTVAAGAAGTAAAGATGMGIGSAIAAGVSAVMAGIGSLVSLPVILTIGAIAAVGYGAYKTYKYFQSKLSNLAKLRMAQYGLSIDEKDHYPRILEMENKILPYVKYSESNANFEVNDVLISDLVKNFGIDPENNKDEKNLEKLQKWVYWFTKRFKPVYLTHLTVLNKLQVKQSLESVDSLDPDTKIKYLNAVRYSDGPYMERISPFEEVEKLQAGPELVEYYFTEALKEAKEEQTKNPKDPSLKGIGTSLGTSVVANTIIDKDGKEVQLLKNDAAPSWLGSKIKENLSLLKNPFLLANPFAALSVLVTKVTSQEIIERMGFGASALEAVRLKTYGLKELSSSKVSSIRALEKIVLDKISFDAQGKAYYVEPISDLLTKIGTEFGITDQNSKRAQNFIDWFTARFLPVYLNYLGLVKAATGIGRPTRDEIGLKDSQKFEIAKKTAATLGVWAIKASPFENEESSTDETITHENVRYLEQKAKDEEVAQEKLAKEQSNKANTALVAATVNKLNDDGKQQPYRPTDSKSKFGFNNTWGGVSGNDANAESLRDQNRVNANSNFEGFGDDIDSYIKEAAEKYKIDEKTLRGFIKMEGGWTGKMSPTGAIGPGQFTQGTWDDLAQTPEGAEIGMTKIGDRFRTPEDPRHDKKINILATALLAKKNKEKLEKSNLPVTGENLYLMHNIGPGYIKAATTGEASPATMKAMEHNGMKAGMTPTSFVQYQKDRYNNHYQSANRILGSKELEEQRRGYQRDSRVGNSRDHNEAIRDYNYRNNDNNQNNTISSGNSNVYRPYGGGYIGSINNTRPDSEFKGLRAPDNELDDFAALMRRNRDIASRADRIPNINPNTVINGSINSTVGNLHNVAVEQLTVQKQMLSTLRDISEKIEQPIRQQEPEQEYVNPPYLEAKTQEPRKTTEVSKTPIVMSRA